MARFCGFCGAPSEGGSFCTSCGQRFPDAAAAPEPEAPEAPSDDTDRTPPAPQPPPARQSISPYAPPPARPSAQPVSPQPTWQPGTPVPAPPPAARPSVPRPPVVNPFAGVPVGDYVRDVAAVVCLFATLGKPWDIDGDGTDHWWVILSALVAVASLAIPYVAASGVVPGLGRDQAQLLKLAANAPVVVCVLAAIVNDLVHATEFLEGGLGPGVALALAGALFAAQPRAADEDLALRDDRRWWAVTCTLAVAAVVVSVAQFAAFVLRDLTGEAFLLDEPAELMSLLVAPLLLVLLVYGWSAREAVTRHFSGVLVFGTAGLTAAGVALLTGDSGDGVFSAYSGLGPIERWDSPVGGVFALSAAGALALSRPSLRVARPAHPITGWLHTARLAFGLVAGGAALVAISLLLSLIAADSYPGAAIADAAMWLVVAVVSCVIVALLSGATLNRLSVVSLAAAVPILGIVLVAVGRSGDDFTVYLGAATTALLFTLPALAICALTIPVQLRRTYGPLLPERAAPPHPGTHPAPPHPQQQWPAQPPAQPPSPG